MRGATIRQGLIGKAALGLIALALLLRILIPAGFMPAEGKGFAITLCTSMGAKQAWVDDQGRIHEGKSAPDQKVDHPCSFASSGWAFDLPDIAGDVVASLRSIDEPFVVRAFAVAIGRGLAAPPPPPTGPPANL